MSLLILEPALRALALAIAAWALFKLLRVRNVIAQKCAWTMVLAASVVMPVLLIISTQWRAWPAATLRLPTIARRQAAAPVLAQAQPHAVAAPHIELSPAEHRSLGRFPAPIVSPDYAAITAQEAVPAAPRFTLSNLVLLVYFAVAAVFLVRLFTGLGSALLLWRKSELVSLDTSRLAPGLRLRTSSAVSSPVSVRNGVVLPADYITWDQKKLRIVLAHERSHVRQGDFYLQLLAGLYQALVWFSPLGWWLKHKLSDLGEAISDRAGLAEAASRFSYAQVLLEFAVAPRTTLIGVAMAHPSSLSLRMERLLNESAFRQAFAGGRRALLAALIVPALLIAATTLVRVEAATAPVQSATTGQSHPDVAPILESADAQPGPQNQSQPATQPQSASPVSHNDNTAQSADDKVTNTNTNDSDGHHYSYSSDGYSDSSNGGYSIASKGDYAYWSSDSDNPNGDAYALVVNNDGNIAFSGFWNEAQHEEIERLRKTTTGSFLWFRHEGKSYIITDPAIIERIEAMYRPMQELGKQQEALGRQQEALGKQQETLGHSQESASVTAPDMSEQMAKLKKVLAELQAHIDQQVTQAITDELQASLSEVQARIGAIQSEIGAKQGEIGARQGELGEKQGKLGELQGHLGAEQGRLGREVDQKVKSIIDQSLKNGTAQPAK